MIGRDEGATYAHLALQNHNVLPRDYLLMEQSDRAFLLASDLVKVEEEKRGMEKIRKGRR